MAINTQSCWRFSWPIFPRWSFQFHFQCSLEKTWRLVHSSMHASVHCVFSKPMVARHGRELALTNTKGTAFALVLSSARGTTPTVRTCLNILRNVKFLEEWSVTFGYPTQLAVGCFLHIFQIIFNHCVNEFNLAYIVFGSATTCEEDAAWVTRLGDAALATPVEHNERVIFSR